MSQTDAPARDQPDEGAPTADVVGAGPDNLLDRSPVGRRTLMKGIGASAAGAVALGSDYGMVDDADALVGTVLVGGLAAGAVAGWLIREYEVVGSNPPAEGLTAGALKQDVYQTARTRKSTNASTFVDNRNIINSGLSNTLYAEGKIAAIEQLNQQAAKADVEPAAHDAMNKYAATIEKNFLKSWNESIRELESLLLSVSDHPDLTLGTVVEYWSHDTSGNEASWGISSGGWNSQDTPVTLSDGSDFTVKSFNPATAAGVSSYYHPAKSGITQYRRIEVIGPDSSVQYLWYTDWNGVWSDLQNVISNVQSGLTTWVNTAYDQVQSGEIEVSELITPRERAKMIAADNGAAQAIADLYALGVPVDAGNKYTITMADTGATIRGTLAVTDDSQTIESGSSYNPSADTFSGDAFFTYNVATASGDWSAYNENIDGGVVTFNEEPYQNARYELTTSKNETVTVTSGNFTAVDSSGNPVDPTNTTPAAWEIDVSEELENDIANLTGVDFFANVDKPQMETIRLDEQFTIEKIVNTETNEEVDSASFESPDPQTDSNYITQEEWQQLQEQNRQLIEKYKQSQSTGGGGINFGQFDMFGLPGEIVALVAGGIALLIGSNN